MRRFFVPLAGALALAAGAGLSLPSAANDTEGVVPKLELVHSISRGRYIDISAFSEDGSTFLAAGKHDGVRLYRTSNFELLEKFNDKWRFRQQEGESTWSIMNRVLGAGYIDKNTLYYIIDHNKVMADPTKEFRFFQDTRYWERVIHIRSIDPPREIYTHTFPNPEGGDFPPLLANENYVLYTDTGIFNWRTEEIRTRIPDWSGFGPGTGTIALTHDGRVLINIYARTVISDPFGGRETEKYPFVSTLTPDERYLIALEENGDCALRLFDEKREIARCGTARPFGFGIKKRATAVSPDSKMFAISINDKVRVYRIEPFRLERTFKAPKHVKALALSNDGWLASGDENGHLLLWDIASGKLAGKFDDKSWANSMAFQPGGNLLVLEGSEFFALPPRPDAGAARKEP